MLLIDTNYLKGNSNSNKMLQGEKKKGRYLQLLWKAALAGK